MADTLYVNGNIWTGVEGEGTVETLAVKDGSIFYAGASKVINGETVFEKSP